MSLLNISVKSFGLAPEFTLPDEEEQESLTSSKTKLTTQTVEDAIGEFGLFQKVLYFLLWFPAAAMAIGVYASVYLEYTPLYHCVSGMDSQDPSFQSMYNPNNANLTCSSLVHN